MGNLGLEAVKKVPVAMDKWQINGGSGSSYYAFSPQTCQESKRTLQEATNKGNIFWGTGKGAKLANTYKATTSLLQKAVALEAGEKVTYDDEIAIYDKAVKQQQKSLKGAMAAETEAMKSLAQRISALQ